MTIRNNRAAQNFYQLISTGPTSAWCRDEIHSIYSNRYTNPAASHGIVHSTEKGRAVDFANGLMLRSPRLREAYEYWNAKRQNALMPTRSHIDPVEIPRLLPYIILLDVFTGPVDFRYRLIGTAARSIMRGDYTGQLFSQISGKGGGSALWRGCESVVASKRPISESPPYVGPDRHLKNCENVLLPLSEDRINVNMILKVISFERVRGAGNA
jgi:hypothetical protein